MMLSPGTTALDEFEIDEAGARGLSDVSKRVNHYAFGKSGQRNVQMATKLRYAPRPNSSQKTHTKPKNN